MRGTPLDQTRMFFGFAVDLWRWLVGHIAWCLFIPGFAAVAWHPVDWGEIRIVMCAAVGDADDVVDLVGVVVSAYVASTVVSGHDAVAGCFPSFGYWVWCPVGPGHGRYLPLSLSASQSA